ALFIPRLEIALAVITALRTARRGIAVRLPLVARARLLAAGPLHQHPLALAIGNQGALARRLERLLPARRFARVGVRIALLGQREIRTRPRDHLVAELLAQHARLHLIDRAFAELAELERTIGDTDQPVYFQPQMRQHVAHLAVLAFADCEHQPDIGALITLQDRIDRTVFDALDLDALLQRVELGLRD